MAITLLANANNASGGVWTQLFGGGPPAIYDSESAPGPVTPHPAVARIIAPEEGATSFGSGTLVAVKDQRALVITNWHVVRDATGLVEVVFPDGFRSNARPLKIDQDWDLAALVIWRPNADPVKIATQPPRPGDPLTIHGYGRGKYRIATGRCTNYYSPQPNFPHEMVELDVEARQGDSGGPIFNQSGELAGVLFGAGQGTTMGSFAPRVRFFLAAVAPDLDQLSNQPKIAVADRTLPAADTTPSTTVRTLGTLEPYPSESWAPSSPWQPKPQSVANAQNGTPTNGARLVANNAAGDRATVQSQTNDTKSGNWFDPARTILAAVGIAAIVLRGVKTIR